MFGALPLILPLSLPLLVFLKLPLGTFWDVAAISILVGMIFTRIGCLLNGCCGGRRVGGRRLPTQPLEAAFAAVLLAGAIAAWGGCRFRARCSCASPPATAADDWCCSPFASPGRARET